jgi:ribonuclease VapC
VDDVVFDSSVLLTLLLGESGSDRVEALLRLRHAVMSTVNIVEVRTRLSDRSLTYSPHVEPVFSLLRRVEPFTEEQAFLASDLRTSTMHRGLSLGDRACLALAITLGAEVYTTDKAWNDLDVGCKIHLLR